MNDRQLSIDDFDGKTYAQANHPDTAHAAAEAREVMFTARSDEALCYRYLAMRPDGLTNDDLSALIEEHTGRMVPPNQIASRTMTLRDKGLVRWTETTRTTRRGRQARVMEAIE